MFEVVTESCRSECGECELKEHCSITTPTTPNAQGAGKP
jgi:hypothetical protein